MIGSVIGDIVGSIYEFDNIKKKQFPFFGRGVEFTDDSVLTFATADWILSGARRGRFMRGMRRDIPAPWVAMAIISRIGLLR